VLSRRISITIRTYIRGDMTESILPIRKSKKWKTKESTVKREFKPLHPNFCPNIKEDGSKCGKFMRSWDIYFYDKHGIGCEICTIEKLKEQNIES
jgi:hypothetical protein